MDNQAMSEALSEVGNSVAMKYQRAVFVNSPHMNVLFDRERNVLHCNPTALRFLGLSSVQELRDDLPDLLNEKQADGRNSMEVFREKFNEAEENRQSEFEFLLYLSARAVPVHLIITRVVYEESYIFIVTGYDLSALREAERNLVRQDNYLNALSSIGEVLLSAGDGDIGSEMYEKVIHLIGKTFSASRAVICRQFPNGSPEGCSNMHTWRKEEDQGEEKLYKCRVCISDHWRERLRKGEIVSKRRSEANDEESCFFQSNGVQSVTVAPILINGALRGSVGLFYEETERTLTISAINAISGIANLLGSRISRDETAGMVMKYAETNRALLDYNPFSSLMFDKNGMVLDCNLSARKFFNLGDAGDLGEEIHAMLSRMIPSYQPDGRRSVPFSDRLSSAFREGAHEFETAMHIGGKVMYFSVRMKRVVYKGKDAVVIYMFDQTEQKEGQLALEYNGRLWESLGRVSDILLSADAPNWEQTLHAAMDVVGRASAVDRVYVWKNHVGEDGRLYTSQLYEWSPDAVPQQGTELMENIDVAYVMPNWEETLNKRKSISGIVSQMGPEMQAQLSPQGIVSVMIVPIFLYNKFWGFIGFDECTKERAFTSIEESVLSICGFMIMVVSDTLQNELAMNLRAEKEAALISAQIKTNFLANMSHEIRTPMNAILGMTELILHDEVSATVSAHATDIRNACRGLLAIIDDILDISRIESGRLEILPTRYQISSMLMDVISIIKTRADKKGIAFLVNIAADLPCEMYGDEVRIRQILINLLNNAIKFTHQGKITLLVNSEAEGDGACRVTFSVSDTGVGIKPEDVDKIFVLFQQVDTKKNRNIEGTGLGLSISRQLAEMMDGAIEVQSEYGVGSTFTAVIKQGIADRAPIAALKQRGRTSVLVCENRSAYLSSISYTLDSLGCPYKICTHRAEMLDDIGNGRYDYIFVSSLYVDIIWSAVLQKQPNAVVVVLSGDGRPARSDLISVSMPIHCLQLVHILNGEYAQYSNKPGDLHVANVVAPDAKVLVVDDNVVNLKVAVGLLNIYSIRADTASSGMQAVEMVQRTDYDLVFMDHMMPEMDGIDTTAMIRKLGGRYADMPIVALTANAVSGVREMYRAEGLNDFLPKPIDMLKLGATLKTWLPKDKQQAKKEDAGEAVIELEILGVDTREGLQNSGETLGDYNEILGIYVADCENRIGEILRHYENGDIKALTVCVHAMKSAAANIGAMDVAQLAADLETAGREGDADAIDARIGAFTDSLSVLLLNIRGYLRRLRKRPIPQSKVADADFLKNALNEISRHMENADVDSVEKVLAELYAYRWDEDVSSWIVRMKECADVFDYDGIEAATAELLLMSRRI